MGKKIILLPIKNPYKGHGADAPQVPDKLRIPQAPDVDVAEAMGVKKAMNPDAPSVKNGTSFKKS